MDINLYQEIRKQAIESNNECILSNKAIGIMDMALANYDLNSMYRISITSSKYDLGDTVENGIVLLNYFDKDLESLKSKNIINDYSKSKMIGLKYPEVGYYITLV
jgi:hypothetical protein